MTVGPVQFDAPLWLLLFPPLALLAWWMGRGSIGGLTRRLRLAALAIRLIVMALVIAALAQPHWRKRVQDLAVVAIVDVSASMTPGSDQRAREYLAAASASAATDDRLGLVTAARQPLVQALPSAKVRAPEPQFTGDREATDLASAVRLASAVLPEDAAPRLVLITDGNETSGGLLAAAEAARAANIPIDVLPVRYDIRREVIFDRVIAPSTARMGQVVDVRFALTATAPTRGRLTLLINDQVVDLDPEAPGESVLLELEEGLNVRSVPIAMPTSGPQRYRAVFEPEDASGDAIAENNTSEAITFVAEEGRVLVYADEPTLQEPLVRALREAGVTAEVRQTPATHTSLIELSAYDAVILADTGAFGFSLKQQDELRAYVHDVGGGLVVVGGPESLGAGGWIGSPLADALPLKLDPPQRQEHLRGALVLVMHSTEMPQGNYWGQETALAAVNALTRVDLAGVLEYSFTSGGSYWAHPLSPLGDKSGIRRAIKNLVFGDMPDFASTMQMGLTALINADAGHKHMIIISDGDASGPGAGLIQKFIDEGVSVSTVTVFPHAYGAQSADVQKMRNIAQATGGNFYLINNTTQTAQLPQIFIKEAKTVVRALLWEGEPAQPTITNGAAEPMRGIAGLPPITGYVVTTDREGLALTTAKTHQGDPLVAQWQHGLGRSVVFTSDAAARWATAWPSWEGYRAFWEQHVRWAMRPTGSANINIITEQRGDTSRVVVEALDSDGNPLNFAAFRGQVVTPGLESTPLELRMTGPGRYEGVASTPGDGLYTINMRYEARDGAGEVVDRGNAQAAIVKPPALERRALQSNESLLRRVAETTGGRVLTGDPARDELFSRAGMPPSVATRSFWLPLAVLACGLFLVDVAVRRVRIDADVLRALWKKVTAPRAKRETRQVDALRTARERAQRRVGAGGGEPAPTAREVASRKFEAQAGEAGAEILDTGAARRAVELRVEQASMGDGDEEGLSRLLRAKRRAQGGGGTPGEDGTNDQGDDKRRGE